MSTNKPKNGGTSLLALMTHLAVRHLEVPTVLAPTISARCGLDMTSLNGGQVLEFVHLLKHHRSYTYYR